MACNGNDTTVARLRAAACLCMALASAPSWACRAAPLQQLMGVNEQLALASDVAVAQVVSVTPLANKHVEYRFLVLQHLAGAQHDGFVLRAWNGGYRLGNSTFDHHAEAAFWQRGGGRAMNGSDCVIHPEFVLGDSYLMFLGSPATRRSYEKIEVINGVVHEGDQWLAFVKQGLGMRRQRQAP